MIFVYGKTPYPRQTTDIYLPLTREDNPVSSGEREPIRVTMDSTNGHYYSRTERSYMTHRGHRCGVKGRTLRDHRA